MPVNMTLATGMLVGFLLVLARVAGVLALVPLPGVRSMPEPARVVLALAIAVSLYSRWPVVEAETVTAGRLAGWVLAEAATGLAIGLAMALILEMFALAAQMAGLQAGYAYASTIDPKTQADSGVLLVLAQLTGGLLFFSIGLDREMFRLLARSLEVLPPGDWGWSRGGGDVMIRMTGTMLVLGFRLALPVVALLMMVDLALALLGRLNQQLQLITLSFPAKMLVALLMLAWGMELYPRLLRVAATDAFHGLRQVLGS